MSNFLTTERVQALMAEAMVSTSIVDCKTCVVTVVLPSGIELKATSSCVEVDHYDEQVGKDICLRKIERQLYELEDYRLRSEPIT